jgi:hypothetical protein
LLPSEPIILENYLSSRVAFRQTKRKPGLRFVKLGHEMDFMMEGERKAPVAIEAEWNADAFDPDGLQAFRKLHPTGANFVVSANVDNTYARTLSGLEVNFCSLAGLMAPFDRIRNSTVAPD